MGKNELRERFRQRPHRRLGEMLAGGTSVTTTSVVAPGGEHLAPFRLPAPPCRDRGAGHSDRTAAKAPSRGLHPRRRVPPAATHPRARADHERRGTGTSKSPQGRLNLAAGTTTSSPARRADRRLSTRRPRDLATPRRTWGTPWRRCRSRHTSEASITSSPSSKYAPEVHAAAHFKQSMLRLQAPSAHRSDEPEWPHYPQLQTRCPHYRGFPHQSSQPLLPFFSTMARPLLQSRAIAH